MRSFEIVEFKLFESDFFLERLALSTHMSHAEFYLSAFLSASRSVTFAMQAALRDSPGFESWYAAERAALGANQVATWALRARNASQKEGATFIQSSRPGVDGRTYFFEQSIFGTEPSLHYFARLIIEPEHPEEALDLDVWSKCAGYMTDLVAMAHRCFQAFGPIIDPQQYYTIENMRSLGKTVEDFERELDLEPGCTAGESEVARAALLCRYAPDTQIDDLFRTYLGLDRFGREIGEPMASQKSS